MFPPHWFRQEPKPAVYSNDLGLPTLEGTDQQQQGPPAKEVGVGNPSEEQTAPLTMSWRQAVVCKLSPNCWI
jgi:hypothetical protein